MVFFMVRGYEEMEKCLKSRSGISKDVMWPIANLANQDERMEFVLRAATQFDVLLRNPATYAQLETSITEIAEARRVK